MSNVIVPQDTKIDPILYKDYLEYKMEESRKNSMNKENELSIDDETISKSNDDNIVITNETNTKKETLGSILFNWISDTSSHGIPKIINKELYMIKFMWSVFVIISWAACFYFIINTFVQFFKWDVNVSATREEERPAQFPAIDICNLNPYDGNKVTLEPVNEEYVLVDGLSLLDSAKNFKIKADAYIKKKSNEFEDNASKGLLNITWIGYQLKDMLVSCRFQEQPCTVDDFTQYHNYYYGNCYRFNGGLNALNQKVSIRKTTMPGWRYGLQIELFTGIGGVLSYNNGFRILIHNQTDIAVFPEEDGINIAPGFLTNVAIERTLTEKLSYPYNDCLDNLFESKYNYLILKSNTLKTMKNSFNYRNYDSNLCIKMCLQKYIIDSCGCSAYDLPNYFKNQQQGCSSNTQQSCASQAQTQFFNSPAVIRCQNDCPNKCTFFKYQSQISVSKYPTNWYISNLRTSIILDDYNQYVSLINLYYNEMSYTKVVESPLITVEMLFGNFGGQLVFTYFVYT
jgi:hypothetical protein